MVCAGKTDSLMEANPPYVDETLEIVLAYKTVSST